MAFGAVDVNRMKVAGDIRGLLTVLQGGRGTERRKAADAILDICKNSQEGAEAVAKAGAVPVLVLALDDEDILVRPAAILSLHFMTRVEKLEGIVQAGGIPALLRAQGTTYPVEELSGKTEDVICDIVVSAALQNLLDDGGGPGILLEAMEDVNEQVRQAALETMTRLANKGMLREMIAAGAIPVLLRAQRDVCEDVRVTASITLGSFADTGGAKELLKAGFLEQAQELLQHPCGDRRGTGFVALPFLDLASGGMAGKVLEAGFLPLFVAMLNSNTQAMRYGGGEALGGLAIGGRVADVLDAGVLPKLMELTGHNDHRARRGAARILALLGSEKEGFSRVVGAGAIPRLTELLKDSGEDVREKAAWALGFLGHSRKGSVLVRDGVITALWAAREDPNKEVAKQAVFSIGTIAKADGARHILSSGFLKILTKAVNLRQGPISYQALYILRHLGMGGGGTELVDAGILPLLKQLLEEKDFWPAAAESLEELADYGQGSAVLENMGEELMTWLRHEDPGHRSAATSILSSAIRGGGASLLVHKGYLPRIAEQLKEKDEAINSWAAPVLNCLARNGQAQAVVSTGVVPLMARRLEQGTEVSDSFLDLLVGLMRGGEFQEVMDTGVLKTVLSLPESGNKAPSSTFLQFLVEVIKQGDLERVQAAEPVDLALKMLKERDRELQYWGIRLIKALCKAGVAEELRAAGAPAALNHFLWLLGNICQAEAVRALGYLGDPSVIPDLEMLMESSVEFRHRDEEMNERIWYRLADRAREAVKMLKGDRENEGELTMLEAQTALEPGDTTETTESRIHEPAVLTAPTEAKDEPASLAGGEE